VERLGMNYWYRDERSRLSYQAGYSFGKLYYSGYPLLSREDLDIHISKLNVSKRFYSDTYCEGFKLGYLAEQVRLVGYPTNDNIPTEETMGRVNQHKQVVQDSLPNSPFLTATALSTNNVPFCLVGIRTLNGQFGEQWALDVIVDLDFLFESGATETGEGTVTVSKGTSVSRDMLIEELKGDLPQHNCLISVEHTKAGRPFYTLVDGDDTDECPCSFVPDKEPPQKREKAPTAKEIAKAKRTAKKTVRDDVPF